MSTGRRLLLFALPVALLAAAGTARGQDATDDGTAVTADQSDDGTAADDGTRPRSTPAPATAADPYPLPDAGLPAEDGLADPNADPALDPTAAAPAPAAADLGLRPSTMEVAPLATVVRPVAPSNVPALPVTGPPPLPRDGEAEARSDYDPVGIRIGSFRAYLTTTSTVGYSSNPSNSASGGGSAYVRGTGELDLRSGWERHGVDVTLRGGLTRFLDSGYAAEPTGEARVDTRIDVTDVDRIGVSADWQWYRESASSAELGTTSTGSDVHVLTGSVGYERSAGLIGLALKGAVDRTLYAEGDERTNTAVEGSLRLSLDSGAAVQPFVEGGVFTRRYDARTDSNGYARSSLGWEIKTGAAIDTGLLAGEASVGYAVETPEDASLPAIQGVTTAASLDWTPTELATVRLSGSTSFEPSQLAGASGSITRTVNLDLAYALQPNVTLSTGAGFSYQDYTGVSRSVATTTVRAAAEWRLNRTVALGLAATHQITDSSVAGEDARESTVEATVTLRR